MCVRVWWTCTCSAAADIFHKKYQALVKVIPAAMPAIVVPVFAIIVAEHLKCHFYSLVTLRICLFNSICCTRYKAPQEAQDEKMNELNEWMNDCWNETKRKNFEQQLKKKNTHIQQTLANSYWITSNVGTNMSNNFLLRAI